MIHLLRKVRNSLLKNNAFNKYLLYALGEIVLVVLGILLALYLNNWNQSRKSIKDLEAKFEAVQEELLDNIWECKFWMEYNQYKDSVINLIINDELVDQDYIDNPNYAELIISIHDIDIHNHEFQNLAAVSDKIPSHLMKSYQNLVRLNSDRAVDVLNNDDLLQGFSYNMGDYWSNKHVWFKDIYKPTISQEALNYFVNDAQYVNEVTRYYDYFVNTMTLCRLYVRDAVNCYENIASIINPDEPPHELITEAKAFLEHRKKESSGD